MIQTTLTIVGICLITFLSVEAFSPPVGTSSFHRMVATRTALLCKQRSTTAGETLDSARRKCLAFLPAFFLASTFNLQPSNAAMENAQKVFKPGQALGVDAAKARFEEGRASLKYLIDNYDEIQKGGGDNVRRYIGTVGTSSGLYGIMKVLKELQPEADDIVEYTENMSDFNYYLTAAESAAYSAIFVVTSSSSTPPQKYFDDARRAAKRMLEYMDNMAKELNM